MKRKEFIRVLGLGALTIGFSPSVFAYGNTMKSDFEKCKKAWEKLCGNVGDVYKNDAFKYVHPVKGIPNVLLYGDSISIGYTPAVREGLEGRATVFRLFKNGGSSHDFIPNMDQLDKAMFQPNLEEGWDFKWDLIHFNVGLHDLKYLKGKNLNKKEGIQVSSIAEYKANLNEICNYLKSNFPKALNNQATHTS